MKFNQLVCALCIFSPIAASANDHATQKWDGLYIGAKAGHARADTNLNVLDADESRYPDFAGGELITNISLNSGFAGAEIGYQLQHENWVFGIFGSSSFLNAKDTKWSKDACCGTGDDKFDTELSIISIIGGHVGYALDKVLLYVGAGAAFGKVNISVKDTNVNFDGTLSPTLTGKGSDNKWLNGYALNVGADYALHDAWKLGLEYTYVKFNRETFDVSGESFRFGVPEGKAIYTLSSKEFDTQMLAITLKYIF